MAPGGTGWSVAPDEAGGFELGLSLGGQARLIAADGEEGGRGTGTFMRSHIALSSLDAYRAAAAG